MKSLIYTMLISFSPLWATFDFGECSGSGTFEQEIIHYQGNYENTVTVGTIPEGIIDLKISLHSTEDVDIRLYAKDNEKIVHWPMGLLHLATEESQMYQEALITYSGYNGSDNQRGHEYIHIEGMTSSEMTIKAFGYLAGYATINYSWTGKKDCIVQSRGSSRFTHTIEKEETSLVGTIPPNITDVFIELNAPKDLDIQLYSNDGVAIVSWEPKGLLSDSILQNIEYHGMNIIWSGYNGIDGQSGDEYIKISGTTTEMLVMKVYGYEAGNAEVIYHWGHQNKYMSFTTHQTEKKD